MRVVQHRNADPLQFRVQRRDQVLATAQDVARQAAPELELAVDLEGLAAKRRLKSHTVLAQPQAGLEAIADQHLGQVGIAAVFGQPAHVVEILALACRCRNRCVDRSSSAMSGASRSRSSTLEYEAKRAAGERRVAAARLLWRRFDHGDRGAGLVRRQCRIGGGIAGADHQDIDRAKFRRCHATHPQVVRPMLPYRKAPHHLT